MKFVSIIFAICLAAMSANVAATTEVADFALIDHRGEFHQLSRYLHKNAVVILVYGSDCAATAAALPKLNVLKDKYGHRGVEFLMLSPGLTLGREDLRQQLANKSNSIPVLVDTTQLVSRSLEVARTGEVFVIDPSRMTLLYRGALDSRSTGSGAVGNG